MRYIFNVSDAFTKNDIRDIVKTLEQAYPMGSDVMKTIADVLREEGIEQGIEQGEQKGIAKTLLAFLSRKIEHLPEETKDKLRQLDGQKLETIVNDFHQIETVEDLNKYL
ncbi:protein of unknown function [Halolactibacillus miurensis]|uniref:DUF4351 domain-containing protein n=4 Tax=Halolactibacillus TaxID=306539 RepID=A0A1I6R0N1_9BACI|nr:protein of unknown function [Halolactibacillus miurensis]